MQRCSFLVLGIGLWWLTALSSFAKCSDLRDVQTIIERYEQTRPQPRDLSVYTLDWAPTLQQAKARATAEQRPILFLVVTNSYGNLYTGHC